MTVPTEAVPTEAVPTEAVPTAVDSMSAADRELLDLTMRPYQAKAAIYLRSASVATGGDGLVTADGRFSIGEPCYIDDTGHFNAVESLICFNQLMYFALAVAIRDQFIEPLAHWTLDDYWQHQLPDVLIFRQSVTYRRAISSADFTGRFELTSIDQSSLGRGMLKLASSITFEDADGGLAVGEVALALLNVTPEQPGASSAAAGR